MDYTHRSSSVLVDYVRFDPNRPFAQDSRSALFGAGSGPQPSGILVKTHGKSYCDLRLEIVAIGGRTVAGVRLAIKPGPSRSFLSDISEQMFIERVYAVIVLQSLKRHRKDTRYCVVYLDDKVRSEFACP